MSQQSSAGLELPQDSEHSVETRRLVSEDSSHYILIKGEHTDTWLFGKTPHYTTTHSKELGQSLNACTLTRTCNLLTNISHYLSERICVS